MRPTPAPLSSVRALVCAVVLSSSGVASAADAPSRVPAAQETEGIAARLDVQAGKKGGGAGPFKHRFFLSPWIPISATRDEPDADWIPAVGIGGQAAWKWWLQLPAGAEGDVHSSGRYMFAGNWTGWEWTGGFLVGPRFGTPNSNLFTFSILSGLDARVDDVLRDHVSVGEAWSIGLPLQARLRIAIVHLIGGVQPWWYVSDTARRPVDFDRAIVPGFGDEFDIHGAIGFDVWIMYIQAGATTRITSFGTSIDVGLLFAFGFGPR